MAQPLFVHGGPVRKPRNMGPLGNPSTQTAPWLKPPGYYPPAYEGPYPDPTRVGPGKWDPSLFPPPGTNVALGPWPGFDITQLWPTDNQSIPGWIPARWPGISNATVTQRQNLYNHFVEGPAVGSPWRTGLAALGQTSFGVPPEWMARLRNWLGLS